MRYIFCFLFILLLVGCKSEKPPQDKFFTDEDDTFVYSGRTLNSSEGTKLITSAASVKTRVYGDTVTVFLQSDNDDEHHYIAVELNEEYVGRFRVTKDTLKFALPERDSANTLAIYKETEAANGSLIFNGIRAKKVEKPVEEKRAKIEFIGASTTCGMGADSSQIGCEEGEWFDQHSAYMSYGARVARALDMDFDLNCVSGIGVYRNWNDEDQPPMPEVYPYLHLNGNQGKRAEINKKEALQIVSIALGGNDFSLGDGEKERPEFNSEKFKEKYLEFVETIFKRYPDTKMALLSSPTAGEEEEKELIKILKEIKTELPDRTIEIYDFDRITPGGCTGHPSLKDHQKIADDLIPFYRNLLDKN